MKPKSHRASEAEPGLELGNPEFHFLLFLLYHDVFLIWGLWAKLYFFMSCGGQEGHKGTAYFRWGASAGSHWLGPYLFPTPHFSDFTVGAPNWPWWKYDTMEMAK